MLGSLRAVAGDLNRDGITDLVFCPNPDGIQHPRRFVSIAWGGAEGWTSNRISGVLPAWDPRAAAIADLNRDHWPDIVVLAQAPRRQPDGTPVKNMVMKVFWGGRLGFYLGRRQIQELPMSVDMKAADFSETATAPSGGQAAASPPLEPRTCWWSRRSETCRPGSSSATARAAL